MQEKEYITDDCLIPIQLIEYNHYSEKPVYLCWVTPLEKEEGEDEFITVGKSYIGITSAGNWLVTIFNDRGNAWNVRKEKCEVERYIIGDI